MTFEHDVCPVCGQPFAASDDIVVCPDCGTPHHRACWKQSGGCANADKHDDSFVWQSGQSGTTAPAADDDQQTCPVCGNPSAPGTPFCPVCGSPFDNKGTPESGKKEEPRQERETVRCPRCGEECDPDALVCPECGKQLGVATNSRFDYNDDYFLRGVDAAPDTDLDGFTAKEAAMYVQFRAKDYVRKFARIKNGKKAGWNWAAFFFAPYWFFYRKIRKAGALFLGILLTLAVFMGIPLQRVQQQVYATLQEYVTIDESTTPDQLMSAIAALETSQQQAIQTATLRYSCAIFLFFGALFLPNIAAAIVADAVYKKKIEKEVQSMREFAKNAQTFRMLVLRRGGVSVLGLIGSYMLTQLFLNVFILYQ